MTLTCFIREERDPFRDDQGTWGRTMARRRVREVGDVPASERAHPSPAPSSAAADH